jgi:hypothetical protein
MKRAYEALVKEYLGLFPCAGIIGPRQCGKTTLLGTLPKGWKVFDLERLSDRQAISRDPDLFFRLNPTHVAIDEAQTLPELFPALRVAIDQDRATTGRFVITGSSNPYLLKSISETLAGRIAMIEMAPFGWAEVHPSTGTSALAVATDGLASPPDVVQAAAPRGTILQAHEYWFRGGFPEPWVRRSQRFRQVWMDQYARSYLYRDVGRLFPGLNQARFQQFVQMLAGLSGTIVNCSDVGRTLGISQPTARDYFEIAHGTFVWRRIPPYARSAMKRIVKHPKGYLRDSGLLHHLLRIADLDALRAHPQMGNSWEGMVIEEVIRQLTCLGRPFEYSYYRTAAGAEVDLVLEGDFGLLPVEIKYSQPLDQRALRGIRTFVDERGCRMGLVINNDEHPRLLTEKIAGIPFTCL